MNIIAAIFCVILFSLTAPFTRIAALETSPETIILIRILGAALVCLVAVFIDRWLPPKNIWKYLVFTSLGTVIGFNSLMAYGLREVPSGHAAVALASLPLMTAIYSVIRDKMNPGFLFWFFAITGTILSIGFFFSLNVNHLLLGDLLLLLSVFSAAFGYVEGGRLSREHGGRKIMSWTVLIASPFALILSIFYFKSHQNDLLTLSLKGWLSVSYLALVSQSLGMFLWFRVLSIGPMEKVALVQLIQPFLSLLAAIYLLGESVSSMTWVIALLVALCIFGSNKSRLKN